MDRQTLLAAGAALTVALAGCAAPCAEACANTQQVCAESFAAKGILWDVNKCTAECQANAAGCADQDLYLQTQCIAEARTCAEIGDCPTCAPAANPDPGLWPGGATACGG